MNRCGKRIWIGGYEGEGFCERPQSHEDDCDNSFVATRERLGGDGALLADAELGGGELAGVARAEVKPFVSPLGDLAALAATPVDVGRSDPLHNDIVSVESNPDVGGGNVRACRHGVSMDVHCKECSFAGFCGCRECGDDYA
jgi:hypothetical protein